MQFIIKIKRINFDLNSFSIGEKLKVGLIVSSSASTVLITENKNIKK
jgi:hypothetical protein